MAKTTLDTNPASFQSLLKNCEGGQLVTRIIGHAGPVRAEAAEEWGEILASIAHDSGLELIEAD